MPLRRIVPIPLRRASEPHPFQPVFKLLEETENLAEPPGYSASAAAGLSNKKRSPEDRILKAQEELSLPCKAPEGLRCTLMPHQKEGVEWMLAQEHRVGGGLLADVMGLGKTVQAIALMYGNASPYRASGPHGNLIVGPVALLDQWKEEIQKKGDLSKPLKCAIYSGNNRKEISRDFRNYDVVLAGYEVLSKEWPEKSRLDTVKKANQRRQSVTEWPVDEKKPPGPLFQHKWHRVILDEAHRIKNQHTKGALACFNLEARYRWLTATPVQNSVLDLFPLFRFLQAPRPFDTFEVFVKQISDPIRHSSKGRATQKLVELLSHVMLRRSREVLQQTGSVSPMPKLTTHVVRNHFESPIEHAVYAKHFSKYRKLVKHYAASGTLTENYTQIFTELLRLRQACNHPDLVHRYDMDTPTNLDDEENESLGGSPILEAFKSPAMATVIPGSSLQASTKIGMLMTTLKSLKQADPTRKTIVFSSFTSMLDKTEVHLEAEGIKFVSYVGSMNTAQRETILHTIANDPEITVLLASLGCAAAGLNLQSCSVVCFLEPWWNPAIEDQAVGRSYRIGQTRDVDVYKYIIEDTIEVHIKDLQEQKAKLANAVLEGVALTKRSAKMTSFALRDHFTDLAGGGAPNRAITKLAISAETSGDWSS